MRSERLESAALLPLETGIQANGGGPEFIRDGQLRGAIFGTGFQRKLGAIECCQFELEQAGAMPTGDRHVLHESALDCIRGFEVVFEGVEGRRQLGDGAGVGEERSAGAEPVAQAVAGGDGLAAGGDGSAGLGTVGTRGGGSGGGCGPGWPEEAHAALLCTQGERARAGGSPQN